MSAAETSPQFERERLGRALRELRRDRGLSQQEVADALGVHRVSFVRFEQGKQDLGMSHLRALVMALGGDTTAVAHLLALQTDFNDSNPREPDGSP